MKKKIITLSLMILLVILTLLLYRTLNFNTIIYHLSIDKKDVKITERNYKDNYYIEINIDNNIYPFRIYKKLNNKKIVKDIYYYNDSDVQCILPIINGQVYMDFMCYRDSIMYDYSAISGTNHDLDSFVSSVKLYDTYKFKDDFQSIDNIKYNSKFDKTVSITTYDGLFIDDKKISIFKDDVYTNKISTFVDNYYIVADYSNNYSFNSFYVVDLKTKKTKRINVKNDISYDSYIQGVVDNKVYLYDKDNELQYEINIKNSSVSIISDLNYVKYYSNKKWTKMSKIKANKEIYFNYNTLDNNFSDYDQVEETRDYYYLFKKDGISYKLYRVDKKNIQVYKYIIDVPVTDIRFNDNYMYYVYKDTLYFYSDELGFKTVLEYSELEFNDSIKYYIY